MQELLWFFMYSVFQTALLWELLVKNICSLLLRVQWWTKLWIHQSFFRETNAFLGQRLGRRGAIVRRGVSDHKAAELEGLYPEWKAWKRLLFSHINGAPSQLTSTTLCTLASVIKVELHKNGWEEQLFTQVRVQRPPCVLLLWGKVNS